MARVRPGLGLGLGLGPNPNTDPNSLASWQTNLTFQPTLFEEGRLPASPKVRVHSGTYEVSRRLYARLLPLIEQHLASHPKVGLPST